MATAKRGRGRPTKFDAEKANAVLKRIIGDCSVRSACIAEGIASSTFHGWVAHDRDGLALRYRRAVMTRVFSLLDDIAVQANAGWLDKKRMLLVERLLSGQPIAD